MFKLLTFGVAVLHVRDSEYTKTHKYTSAKLKTDKDDKYKTTQLNSSYIQLYQIYCYIDIKISHIDIKISHASFEVEATKFIWSGLEALFN